jgi:hypothetical protein
MTSPANNDNDKIIYLQKEWSGNQPAGLEGTNFLIYQKEEIRIGPLLVERRIECKYSNTKGFSTGWIFWMHSKPNTLRNLRGLGFQVVRGSEEGRED